MGQFWFGLENAIAVSTELMIANLPLSEIWHAHLAKRWTEAICVGLGQPKAAAPTPARALLFVPTGIDPKLLPTSDPFQSLRSLANEESPSFPGWVERRDLFEEAADWLHAAFCHDEHADLFCEAGLSKVGDASLIAVPHVVYQERPLLHLNIAASDVERITRVLRRGRCPWRFLGVVASIEDGERAPILFGKQPVLFICDAFDVDSLIVVSWIE